MNIDTVYTEKTGQDVIIKEKAFLRKIIEDKSLKWQ